MVSQYTEFGKEVKKKLIDVGMTQRKLCEEVSTQTGKYFDDSLLSKIFRGQTYPFMDKFVDAIKDILKMNGSD